MKNVKKEQVFQGLLIEESLEDTSILNDLKITRKEIWDINNVSVEQPSRWTAIFFEVPFERVGELAKRLSVVLKQKGWYLEMEDGAAVYVVFPGKIFKYCRNDTAMRDKAKEYGRTLGIPEKQLDWK